MESCIWRSWTSTPVFGKKRVETIETWQTHMLHNNQVSSWKTSTTLWLPPQMSWLHACAQHATCATVCCDIPGSHDLVTRNLESSFSLQLQAPHERIRRGSEAFEWTLDRHTLRCDRETWWPATAGATLIFAFISCVLFRAATLPLSNVGGSSYRHCCVLDKSVSDQSVWPANTVKCNKHYMHVSHTFTPLFSGLSSCCTFLSFHIPLLPLLTILPCRPLGFKGEAKFCVFLEKAVVKLDCDNPRQLSKSTT